MSQVVDGAASPVSPILIFDLPCVFQVCVLNLQFNSLLFNLLCPFLISWLVCLWIWFDISSICFGIANCCVSLGGQCSSLQCFASTLNWDMDGSYRAYGFHFYGTLHRDVEFNCLTWSSYAAFCLAFVLGSVVYHFLHVKLLRISSFVDNLYLIWPPSLSFIAGKNYSSCIIMSISSGSYSWFTIMTNCISIMSLRLILLDVMWFFTSQPSPDMCVNHLQRTALLINMKYWFTIVELVEFGCFVRDVFNPSCLGLRFVMCLLCAMVFHVFFIFSNRGMHISLEQALPLVQNWLLIFSSDFGLS